MGASSIIIMDSTNLHHQQQHHHHVHENHQLVESSANSSPSLSSSCFSVAENDHNAWRTPSFFLNNNGNIHASCDDNNEAAPISLNNPLIQDPQMGFIWPNNISINQSSSQQVDHHHHQQLIADNIKEEQPSSSTTSSDQLHHHHHHHQHDSCNNFMKFSDMLSSSSSTSEMLLLENTLSTSYKNHMLSNSGDLQHSPFQASMHYQNTNKGISTTFSQIFPSVNISNISNNAHNNNNNNNNNNNMSSPMSSGSSTIDQMANNVQPCGFDLFATARLLGGEISLNNHPAPSNNNNNNHLLELFEGSPRFSVEHDLQQSNELKRCNNIPNNISSFDNNGGQAESKNYIMEQKSAHQLTNKKPRIESRSSCPPFKVRKEKLGDRIAALQQLVSPFGKTDTASVLMEAIGYIKFLQNQVETLSVPYMKLASRSKSSNTQRVSDEEYCESDEQKLPDLRSRGLCLVPTSCMSYINIANDPINGGIWPPPNFNPSGGF